MTSIQREQAVIDSNATFPNSKNNIIDLFFYVYIIHFLRCGNVSLFYTTYFCSRRCFICLSIISKFKERNCFVKSGSKLATVSGDTTVKVWDFAKAECVHTFVDHQKAGKMTTFVFISNISPSTSKHYRITN